MLARPHTVSRIFALAGACLVLAFAAGCAGSSASPSAQTTGKGATKPIAAIMRGGPGHTSIRGVRIAWNRKADGRICYWAKDALLRPLDINGLVSCIRHLRSDEITYALTPQRKTGRLLIVGLRGPLVKSVYLQLSGKRWTPPTSGGAFFGAVPQGHVLSVVKVLRDGHSDAFAVNRNSR